MLGIIRRYLGRRQLLPMVSRLPIWLAKNFGANDYYSPGQVKRGAVEFNLTDTSTTIALAACCTAADFQSSFPSTDLEAYYRFRDQLTELFDIPVRTFTCKHLRALERARIVSGSPAGDSTQGGHQ